jgi:N-acetylmuramoyl-L-alanine amidase
MLDPGHGGEDSGAVSAGGIREKDLTLDLSRRVAEQLERGGLRVLHTRTRDRDLTLEQRVAIANRRRPDLFVSIHLNAAANRGASGVETFITSSPAFPSTNSPQTQPPHTEDPNTRFSSANAIAGFLVQRSLLAATHAEDRGLRRARFFVIKNAPCPALLVEGGFVSNPGEEAKLRDPSYRQSVANGIAQGILLYADAVQRANLR